MPNFRLYISGHFTSMTGSWMQGVALSWLVWRLTNSADWLGGISFVNGFLIFLLGLFGGAVADRVNRKHMIMAMQVLAMLQAVALAILIITDKITPEIILGLVPALSLIDDSKLHKHTTHNLPIYHAIKEGLKIR